MVDTTKATVGRLDPHPAGELGEVVEGEIVDPDDEAAAGRLQELLATVISKVRSTVVADVARLRRAAPRSVRA